MNLEEFEQSYEETGEVPDGYQFADGMFDLCDLTSRDFPKIGPYDNREVVSALRKDCKLGDTEAALFWLTVLIDMGRWDLKSHRMYIARQLWIMAGEDCFDQMVVLQAHAVFSMVGTCSETDHLYQLVYRMCKADHVHDSDEGMEMDRLWGTAVGLMKRRIWRKMPSYAVDVHTYRGKVKQGRGEILDQRFSGHEYGRAASMYLRARDGKAMGAGSLLDDRFGPVWKRIKSIYGVALSMPIRSEDDQGQLL